MPGAIQVLNTSPVQAEHTPTNVSSHNDSNQQLLYGTAFTDFGLGPNLLGTDTKIVSSLYNFWLHE